MTDPTFAAGVPGAGVSTEAAQMLNNFWPNATNEIRGLKHDHFKTQELPLARIKKIMKLDEDVKMISAEAPVLFAKAAEVFISELSLRSWIHTEDNKRRTLQRNDIAMAISKFDQFDFLIDIVPREELKPPKRPDDTIRTPVLPDQIQYYLQLAQQQAHQQAAQGATAGQTPAPPAPIQVGQPVTTQIQIPGGQMLQQAVQMTQPVAQQAVTQQAITQQAVTQQAVTQQTVTQQAAAATATSQPQMITIQSQPQQQQTTAQPQQVQQVQQPATQVFQQVFTPSGEVQNVPIQLTAQQLQAIQMQLQGKGGNLIIQQNATVQPTQTVQTITQADQSAAQFNNQGVFQVQQIAGAGGQSVYIQQTDSNTTDS